MGMAASQARYLGLTARKTNVEYEGQQINQARTALGNQSAALWNQMLGLSIPTVPSITDYTTLTYSFTDGINNYTITDMQSVDKKDTDGSEYNKLVTYKTMTTVYKGVESSNTNPQVQHVLTPSQIKEILKSEVQYKKTDAPDALTTYVPCSKEDTTDSLTVEEDTPGSYIYKIGGNPITFTQIDTSSQAYKNYLKANGLDSLTGNLYSYQVGDQIKFYNAASLPTTSGDINSQIITEGAPNYKIDGNDVTFTEINEGSPEYTAYLRANGLGSLTGKLYSYQVGDQVKYFNTSALPTTDGTNDIASQIIEQNGVKYSIGGNDVTFNTVPEGSQEYQNYLTANKLERLTTPLYSYQTADGVTKYTTVALPTVDNDNFDLDAQTITQGYKLGNSEAKVCLPNDPNTSLVDQEAIKQIIYDFGKSGNITQEMFDNGEIFRYEKNGNVYYTTKTELENCWSKSKHAEDKYAISSNMDYQPTLKHYYAANLDEVITSTDYAVMDDASGSGRYSNIKLKNMSTSFNLKAEETTNQAAYNDAMNQYNYDLTKYEKQMSDINAKTSLIQEQDRTLELRLKQLETEQKALTTEIEAVKGVLQKNVESTFGTFK